MRVETARGILAVQDGMIRKLNGARFVQGGYEYRLTYCGGFASIIKIEWREVGKRNFKWFRTIGCHDCFGASAAMKKVMEAVSCG